jgi:cell division protein FtsN
MKTTVDTGRTVHPDTEITLGIRSVLGIFFGLVLVCGVFFGFGYSLGRGGNPAKGSTPVETPSQSASTVDVPTEKVRTVVEQPVKQAAIDLEAVKSDAKATETRAPSKQVKPSAGSILPVVANNIQQMQPIKNSGSTLAAPSKITASNVSIQPAAIMVQVAAVSHRQDADVLVSALSKLGYHSSVNADSADSLLHVQIGPFATRDEAKATRAKLLNDGYNAILK